MAESEAKPMEVEEEEISGGENEIIAGEAAVVAADAGGGAISEDKNPSSDSDSDSDDEAAEDIQIETLEGQLAENPWNYEAHVKYIHCLRKLGHIEKLRQARESMDEHFPLSPSMWQEWTKDEASLSAGSEAFAEIEKLYERGVHEYLSVELWCDYINFIQEHDQLVSQCAPAGVSKMRNLFERALTAAGLHVVEGSKIWEAYREYEQAIFLTIGDNNNEEKTKQVHRIRALFHRQLSVPLVDLKSTLVNYKLWEVEQGNINDINSEMDGIPPTVLSAYQKAQEMYGARKIYEDQLSNCDTSDGDRLQCFMSYINFEESSGHPARVQILYERSVSEFPISSQLWSGYASYVDGTLKVPSIVKDVYCRATRNCTWVGDLWVHYMLSLERLGASEKELSAVFEKAVRCAFPSSKEYLDLFLTRIDGLRRRISFGGAKEDELEYSVIRDTFQRAVDYLSPDLISAEDSLHLYAYWAHLEANLGKDLVAARGVWESLIKRSGSILEVWQGYIAMEIEMGHISEARSIFKRCYSKRFPGTGSEDICHSWLRFEREHGTLSDFDLAMKKVTPRLQELKIFKIQQESKSGTSVSAKENISVAANSPQKRKLTKAANNKQPPAKRQKDSVRKHVDASDADPIKSSQNVKGSSTVDNGEAANLTVAINEQPVGESKLKESRRNVYTDQCTAYVSNISLEANEEHLREFFMDCGGVTAIRLLKDKFTGKSRGLAYVDFSDEEHLAAAIAKNKQRLLGQKLSIARSDPNQSRKRASSRIISTRGRGRGGYYRSDRGSSVEISKASREERRDGDVKLVGKNTFAAPRAVMPLGWTSRQGKADESIEKPKSNVEFREMLLKK